MRTSAGTTKDCPSKRTLWQAVVLSVVLVVGACPAEATLTTPVCLAKKVKEWGSLRKCRATEDAKRLQGKSAHPETCRTRFTAKLAALSVQAKAAAVPCRYEVNGDGTITDYDLGLEWEQKTADGSVHDEGNAYDWSPTLGQPDGTVFTDFLGALNNATSTDGTTSSGCFANHCDWRLPSIVELQSIVDAGAPACGNRGVCIDQTVFGPTILSFYWSATTDADFPVFAWGVAFGADGQVTSAVEDATLFARAVRSAL